MVERFNRTLEAMLSKYVERNQRDWDVHLTKIMMGYRPSVHESTVFSPDHLMFGHEIRLPADIVFGYTPHEPADTLEYVQDLCQSLQEGHKLACAQQKKAQKKYYDCDKKRADQKVTVSVEGPLCGY